MAQEKILGNQLNIADVAADLNPALTMDLVTDTSPQLGGNLVAGAFDIIGTPGDGGPSGTLDLTGGEGLIDQRGGAVRITGGLGADTGFAGSVLIVGGACTGGAAGGGVQFRPGDSASGPQGAVRVEGASISDPAELQFYRRASSNYIGLATPAALSVDQTYTLPLLDGAGGDVLQTDGNGVLSFVTPSGGSGITVTNPVAAGSPVVSTTLALSDADTFMVVDEDVANNIVIPDDTDVAFPIGTRIEVLQRGGGTTTIAVDAVGSPPIFMFAITTGFSATPIDLEAGMVATLTKIAASLWSVALSGQPPVGGG